MKRFLACIAVLLALLLFAGCAKEAGHGAPITVSLEIRCDALLEHMDELKAEKRSLVPESGVLLSTGPVTAYEGDTVFDLLRRELTARKLHFEYTDANLYKSIYIEGICNLYEFDCGPQSGWVYSVNGQFPNLGCSGYTLSDGDQVVFAYTRDLGKDVGGGDFS